MIVFDVNRDEVELRRAVAEADARDGTRTAIARPTDDAWWDSVTAWPPLTEAAEAAARELPVGAPVLLVNPLQREAWNPVLAVALFRFIRSKYGHTTMLREAAWGGPSTFATPAPGADFTVLEWAELADALGIASPRAKVVLEPSVLPLRPTITRLRARNLRRALVAIGVVFMATWVIWVEKRLPAGWPRVAMALSLPAVVLPLGLRAERLDKAAAREAPRRTGR